MSGIRMTLFAAAALLLSACGAMEKVKDKMSGLLQPSPAEQKLSSGVKSYEDGDYKSSMEALQGALDMGLSSKGDRVTAYKYLAFIHCVSGREKQCRDGFKKAFEIDPNFDLKPAEAGHPVWGPVFRSVKAKPAK
ncbi:MAG: TssQ family T6SS-associated lipoprotein [Nitrosomonadales bacterium]|nr:TssQ family T6SS-associated lipoprotein [Nitrosomonadales bacterium]